MPRKRLEDDLSKFYDWMVASGFSTSTAKVYTSACRAIKRRLGDDIDNAAALQTYLAEVKDAHPKVHATYVSAFNCLGRYQKNDGVVANVTETNGTAETKASFPVTVQLALKVLENYNRKAAHKIAVSF